MQQPDGSFFLFVVSVVVLGRELFVLLGESFFIFQASLLVLLVQFAVHLIDKAKTGGLVGLAEFFPLGAYVGEATVKEETIETILKYAEMIYEGKWFTPLREAIQAFVTSTQEYMTGEVKFKLYKGNIIKAGTTSPYTLYNESLASFTTGDLYDHHDADGFITLFGLPLKVRAMKMAEVEANK